jgi:hypothetical protein
LFYSFRVPIQYAAQNFKAQLDSNREVEKGISTSDNDFKMYLSNHLCTEESNQPCGQQLQVTALEQSVRKTQLVF